MISFLSDPRPHTTVDICGKNEEPIGVLHIYLP